MRNARKQERTCSLNLFSCLPDFLIQSPLRFGRLKIYAECNEIKGLHCGDVIKSGAGAAHRARFAPERELVLGVVLRAFQGRCWRRSRQGASLPRSRPSSSRARGGASPRPSGIVRPGLRARARGTRTISQPIRHLISLHRSNHTLPRGALLSNCLPRPRTARRIVRH